jgi:hypothetical protein
MSQILKSAADAKAARKSAKNVLEEIHVDTLTPGREAERRPSEIIGGDMR